MAEDTPSKGIKWAILENQSTTTQIEVVSRSQISNTIHWNHRPGLPWDLNEAQAAHDSTNSSMSWFQFSHKRRSQVCLTPWCPKNRKECAQDKPSQMRSKRYKWTTPIRNWSGIGNSQDTTCSVDVSQDLRQWIRGKRPDKGCQPHSCSPPDDRSGQSQRKRRGGSIKLDVDSVCVPTRETPDFRGQWI